MSPLTKYEVSRSKLSKVGAQIRQTERHTDRHNWMHYQLPL